MTGRILLVIGVVALFAAIVGGGIKFKDIEVGSVKSLWRQGLLGLFGLVVAIVGGAMMLDEGGSPSANTQDIQANDQNSTTVTTDAGNDVNAAGEIVANAAAGDAIAPATENNSADTTTQETPPS